MSRPSIVAERNSSPEKVDIPFVILVILMCGIGFTTLYSGSLGFAERAFGDPLHFVKRQAINLAFGAICLFFLSFINLEKLRSLLPQIVAGTIAIALLPFVPGLGVYKNGAARWIAIGSSTFQPSELIKLTMVFFLANLFAKKHDRLDEPEVSVYPAAIMCGFFVGIVLLQNNFSTAVFLIVIALILFFVAGVRPSWFAKFTAVMLPLVAIMILSKEYRVERVLAFLHPHADPLGAGYQVNSALEALRDGGFWGLGLGNGIRKISSIPEVQSDFIFAVWGEEMGFLGVVMYFALLVAFCARGYLISLRCEDRFRCYLAFGCITVIFIQSVMNSGVVVRFLPATGVPLPFFSSGGSSILVTLCLCGCVINASRWVPERERSYA